MAGHAFVAFVLEIPVARVSIVPDGKGNLGETRHADLPDTPDALAFLLAGEAAEIVIFGQARTAGLGGDRAKARAIGERIARKQGGNADELLEKARQRVLAMMRGEERAMRRMAFELVRRKTVVFEEIEQVLERAFTLANREAVEKALWQKKIARAQAELSVRKYKEEKAAKTAPKGRVSGLFDLSKAEDRKAFVKKFPGFAREGDAEFIGYTSGYIVNGSYK